MCQLRPGMGADQEATPVDEELARIDLRFFCCSRTKDVSQLEFQGGAWLRVRQKKSACMMDFAAFSFSCKGLYTVITTE